MDKIKLRIYSDAVINDTTGEIFQPKYSPFTLAELLLFVINDYSDGVIELTVRVEDNFFQEV